MSACRTTAIHLMAAIEAAIEDGRMSNTLNPLARRD
jgi:hypothetical protein